MDEGTNDLNAEALCRHEAEADGRGSLEGEDGFSERTTGLTVVPHSGGCMRIIAGKFKGSTIEAPRGVLSRPPLAIIREAVFNVLGDSIVNVSVLDLFAGSGSLAIEALSRGARGAHFVDTAKRCIDMVDRNLRKLGISDMCSLTRQDAVEFVKGWKGGPFDLVFADPPFLSGKVGEILSVLSGSEVLSGGAIVVVRTHWREAVAVPDCFKVIKRRKFGESVVQFMNASKAEAVR